MPRHLLTDFELMILLAILRVGADAYGVSISVEIEQTTGRRVVRAAVYLALSRMEEHGLVQSNLGSPTRERGGRAKRFFRLTTHGMREVQDTQRALTALWSGVPALGGLA